MKQKGVRYTIAVFLVNLAYKVSWDGYLDAITDGDFGYCQDCEQRMPDEPSWCR